MSKATTAPAGSGAAAGAAKKPARKQSALTKGYLFVYNVVLASGWAYVLYLLGQHYSQSLAASPVSLDLSPATVGKLTAIAAGAYKKVELPLQIFQTAAIMEVLHVLFGLVPSPFMTTLIQVCSRLFIVWSIGYSIEQSQSHWSFTTMVVSWCITEVIRYVYYAFNLIGGVPSLITWLRYTTFFILYPTGAGSEFVFAYCALPFIQNIYLYYFVCFTLVLYFPLFPVQYFHMISQRRKYLGRGRSSGKAKTQ